MKKIYVFLIAMTLWNLANARIEIGIGLVWIDFDENTVVDFYTAPGTDVKPAKSISFYDDRVHKVWKIKNFNAQNVWLKPEAYNPLYDLLAFRCLENKDGWMKVIVNNNTGLTYWLKATEVNKFTDWLTYLQKRQCIVRCKKDLPILESPDENAKVINFSGKDCFGIKSMKDEWIEITLPSDEKSDNASLRTGWMRWKKGNDLLINYVIGT